MLFLVLIAAVALLVGLGANRLLRPRYFPTDQPALPPPFVAGRGLLLSGLFFAFVLAAASQGYAQAKTAVAGEANVVDNFYEFTEYLDDPAVRQALQGSTVCYLRAVAGPEFDAMNDGDSSPAPSIWTGLGPNGFRTQFKALGVDNKLFGDLTRFDVERGDARRNRLAAAEGAIPPLVFAFMVIVTFLGIVFLFFMSPSTNNLGQLLGLVLFVVSFMGALLLMHGLDRPFSGPLAISRAPIQETARQVTAEFVNAWGDQLPCDLSGNPR